jgi:hypothetical protein
MKTKLIGVIIGLMLITTLFAVANPSGTISKNMPDNIPVSTSNSEDVPVWEIGDTWTYKIDNLTIVVNQTGNISYLYLTIAELPLTVIAIDETSYTLGIKTSVSGNSNIDMNFGNGPINATITIRNLAISGNIKIDKATLGIKGFTASIEGRFWVHIIEQPYFNISIPTLPFKITTDLTTDFSTPTCLLAFPLNTTMVWNSSATNLTLNGEVRSPWFSFILLVDNIVTLLRNEPLLPPEISALLPVVNIQEALTTLGPGNVVQIPLISSAFYCLNTENVTVPDGIYNAYNITILNGMARCYYAPTAGNVVKLSGNLNELIPYISNINMELLDTNYS